MHRLLLLFALCLPALAAQTLDFSHTYPSSSGIWGAAMDAQGNTIVTGKFGGTIDIAPGAPVTSMTATSGFFVAKYSASGAVLWAHSFQSTSGSTDHVGSEKLALDGAGNIYISGAFRGTVDFDPGAGTANLTSLDWFNNPGTNNAFLLKLDSTGAFQWARQFRGDAVVGWALAAAPSGRVYIGGGFNLDMDCDPGTGVATATALSALWNSFVIALDDAGNYSWHVSWDSTIGEMIVDMACDASQRLYVTGMFIGTVQFDPNGTQGAVTAYGHVDALVARYNASGTLDWVNQYGQASTNNNSGRTIRLDGSGNVWVSGQHKGSIDFDTGAGTAVLTPQADVDGFVLKLTGDGDYQWVGGLRSANHTTTGLGGLHVDSTHVWVSGKFVGSLDADPSAATQTITDANGNGYLLKLNHSGGYVSVATFGSTSNFTPSTGASVEARTETCWLAGSDAGLMLTGTFENAAAFWGDSYPVTGFHSFMVKLTTNGIQPIQIATTTLASGIENVAVNTSITAQFGAGGNQWVLDSGTLPPGVVGIPGSGTPSVSLTGTPTTAGSYPFTVRVTDSLGGTDTQAFVWTIAPAGTTPLQITTASLAAATQDEFVSRDITATGGTGAGYQWSLLGGTLPPGVTGLPATATPTLTLSGTPTANGTYSFMVQVQDSGANTHWLSYLWHVSAPASGGGGTTGPTNGGGGCSLAGGGAWGLLPLLLYLMRRRALRK